MINLKEVEENLTTEEVIELVTSLGADRYIEKEEYIIFPTICHNEDCECSNKLYYYKKNKKFHCYTECGDNFNIYELFKRRYETLGVNYNFYNDVVLKIAKKKANPILPIGFGEKYRSIGDKFLNNEIKVNLPVVPEHLLNAFSFFPTPEWLNDGISKESMKYFNILFSIDQNKIIIPHYDINNNLIGIRGRALKEEDVLLGKYMPLQIEGIIYSHPLGYNLYGLSKVKENIKRKKVAIVMESEKAVLQGDTMFGHNHNIIVGVCGNSLSHYQVELLRQCGVEKVIIAFDNPTNPTNEKEKQLQYNKLKTICEKYKYILKMGFIVDRKGLLESKESPTDRGKETFSEMLKYIQWV